MKTNPIRLAVVCAATLAASLVLTACGSSSGGDMSDEDKIKTMHKAHDVPLGPGSGGATAPGSAAPGAAPAKTGG